MTANLKQLPLDLPHRPAMSREDFLVADCNEEAVSWLDNTRNWQACGLIVYGPKACGKTHLAKVWQTQTNAIFLDSDHVRDSKIEKAMVEAVAVIVDNADQVADEETLFHLYNAVKNNQGRLLMTAQTPPKQWSTQLADLSSRLLSLPTVAIHTPSEEVLMALFSKLCHDRQIAVEPDVIVYIVSRVERSFAAIAAAVEQLDHAALSEQRRITIPLTRDVLEL